MLWGQEPETDELGCWRSWGDENLHGRAIVRAQELHPVFCNRGQLE